MKTYLDCIPCFFRQALEAARIAGADEPTQKRILEEVGRTLPSVSLEASPPEIGETIYRLVREVTGIGDPYRLLKQESNRRALAIYPELRQKVRESHDPLLTAVKLAIAGNIIDYGIGSPMNIRDELQRILGIEQNAIEREGAELFNYPAFSDAIEKAHTILYLADNAGETVFDRVLIEEIRCRWGEREIDYAVKAGPAINDALAEDATACGIHDSARVISAGLQAPGTILRLCSKEFVELFEQADMVISKGQGNFEALSQERRSIFFLFMAKCPVVVKELHCGLRDIILLHKPAHGRDVSTTALSAWVRSNRVTSSSKRDDGHGDNNTLQ
ncbi:MAG: damage-control phosphatase ARMT1 family protein [bacterium]